MRWQQWRFPHYRVQQFQLQRQRDEMIKRVFQALDEESDQCKNINGDCDL
jgi:hypothetical protein